MLRLIGRKLALLIVLVPLFHFAAVWFVSRNVAPLDLPAGVTQNQIILPPGVNAEEFFNPPSFWERYQTIVSELRQGDLGKVDRTSLNTYLPQFLSRSLKLTGWSFLVTAVFGLMFGLFSISARTGRMSPTALTVFTIGNSIPGFFFGTVAIVLILAAAREQWFGTRELLLPVQGSRTDKHMILPILTLSLRPIMYVAYVMAGLLENELQQDYVRVARSKGLRWRTVMWRHALPNVAPAVFTALGRSLQMIVGGLILVESLFDWRGIGWVLFNTLTVFDSFTYYNARVFGFVIALFAAILILIDLIAAMLARAWNPLVHQPKQGGQA